MPDQIIPARDQVLVQLVTAEEPQQVSGLYIPHTTDSKVLRGIVVDVGAQLLGEALSTDALLAPGSQVVFLKGAEVCADAARSYYVVPAAAVLARVSAPSTAPGGGSSAQRFFELPSWDEFRLNDYETWRDYGNFRQIVVKVNFLEPFQSLEPLARTMYERCAAELRTHLGPDLFSLSFSNGPTESEGRDARPHSDPRRYVVRSRDDKLNGVMQLFGEGNALQFGKLDTPLEQLHETLPVWMRAMAAVLYDREFTKIVGADYGRVMNVVLTFKQTLRLRGRGRALERVLNSDVMQQFLLLDSGRAGKQATLGALGVDGRRVVRADLNLGFDRDIAGRPYTVFLGVEAPSNEDQSTIQIAWEIQDHSPGNLRDREYGPIFVNFIRDVVFRSFYRQWFQRNDDVAVISELH